MNPGPLNYSPITERRPMFSASALMVMLWIAAGLWVSAVVAQRFEATFRNFKTTLPLLTVMLLSFSHLFLNDFGWVLILLAVVVVPFLWANLFPAPDDPFARRMRRRWLRLAVGLLLVMWLLFVVMGLFAPMISLVQSVSTPPGK